MAQTVAVLTGDVVASSEYVRSAGDSLEPLRRSLEDVKNLSNDSLRTPMPIFRGDSFQGVFSPPSAGLRAAIVLYASFLHHAAGKRRPSGLRIAVAVGRVDRVPRGSPGESTDEVFRLSGETLDRIPRNRRLMVRTPDEKVNAGMAMGCALVDELLLRWTPTQAEAVLWMFRGKTQAEAAERIGITQPSVWQRLRGAGWEAISVFLERSRELLDDL
ncbi:MAG: helix-turn-helix domain-containing protein [Candidatus Eisenbacteria sp.]|nr:helix-turn-helix domain-containing protein [Candidatus Eisenbacteria bacterium]